LSTCVFDAASISIKSTKRPAAISMQALHLPHGWSVMPVSQLSALAMTRASVVLPMPRGPPFAGENLAHCGILRNDE